MIITVFTANKLRHEYLIYKLSKSAEKLFVFQEEKRKKRKKGSYIIKYLKKVSEAEKKIFKSKKKLQANTKIIKLKYGDLGNVEIKKNLEFFQSDLYVVFGTSIIKGKLLNFLLKKKAINIHMGVSPYYNGTDCNFWAIFDNNKHLVGGTLQSLSKKVDQGNIISVVKSRVKKNIYDFSMISVKLIIDKLSNIVINKTILSKKRKKQNLRKNIRNTKSNHFTNEVVKKFFDSKLKI